MKKLLFWMLAGLLFSVTSCELIDVNMDNGGSTITVNISPCEDGEDIAVDSLPQAILDYLNLEFPNIEIDDVEVFYQDGERIFGVWLDNDLEILFDGTGVVISSGDENMEREIVIDSLLQVILTYLNDNFPGVEIEEASIEIEFGEAFFEIDLDDDLDLYFDQFGEFVCQDDDGDDDDGDDDDGDDDDGDDDDGDDDDGDDDDGDDDENHLSWDDLPDSIVSYLNTLFPDLTIEDIDREDLCNDDEVIEVELEGDDDDELEVVFSLAWELLFVSREVDADDLPNQVLDSLSNQYPGYTLEEDDIYKWTMADGSIQYSLEVETDQEDYDVIIAADGTILCSES